ncbi:hypothetical protein [Paracoccus aestuariivivens]|uniref:Uncharacterized protein n=1 Tax=Paracoccus aestuariivivens TaxID=1820333 RepID=A0A6L6J644_9RHOB|nr:hypothetical protein [Paracoccus aestuariivivens]MTH76708.1 hypothetical protein [Paracoccus aestuariivivens]
MFGVTSFSDLRRCVAGEWSPRIGDPNIGAWVTVLFYVTCFVLAVMVLRRLPRGTSVSLWALIAPLMAFLAVNKQLDLQTALTATGRCLSHMQGWYDYRHFVQLGFIAALILLVVMAMMIGLRLLRGQLLSNGLALLGLAILCGFVLVRAVGFHHVDRLISMDLASIRFNFLFENTGLVMIAVNAIFLLRRGNAPRRTGFRPSRP